MKKIKQRIKTETVRATVTSNFDTSRLGSMSGVVFTAEIEIRGHETIAHYIVTERALEAPDDLDFICFTPSIEQAAQATWN